MSQKYFKGFSGPNNNLKLNAEILNACFRFLRGFFYLFYLMLETLRKNHNKDETARNQYGFSKANFFGNKILCHGMFLATLGLLKKFSLLSYPAKKCHAGGRIF